MITPWGRPTVSFGFLAFAMALSKSKELLGRAFGRTVFWRIFCFSAAGRFCAVLAAGIFPQFCGGIVWRKIPGKIPQSHRQLNSPTFTSVRKSDILRRTWRRNPGSWTVLKSSFPRPLGYYAIRNKYRQIKMFLELFIFCRYRYRCRLETLSELTYSFCVGAPLHVVL